MVDQSIRKRTREDVWAIVAGIILDIADRAPESELQPHWPLGLGFKGFGPEPNVTPELGLDVIDQVEILCAADDCFDIIISDNTINTAGDLVDHICNAIGIEKETT